MVFAGFSKDPSGFFTFKPENITTDTSVSFQQSSAILKNILAGGELPETFRESVTTQNLLGLGQASVDISKALSEQVKQIQDAISSLIKPLQPAPLTPDKPTAPESPQEPTLGGDIKDTLSQQLDSLAGALGVSAATAAIVLAGIAGIIFLRK